MERTCIKLPVIQLNSLKIGTSTIQSAVQNTLTSDQTIVIPSGKKISFGAAEIELSNLLGTLILRCSTDEMYINSGGVVTATHPIVSEQDLFSAFAYEDSFETNYQMTGVTTTDIDVGWTVNSSNLPVSSRQLSLVAGTLYTFWAKATANFKLSGYLNLKVSTDTITPESNNLYILISDAIQNVATASILEFQFGYGLVFLKIAGDTVATFESQITSQVASTIFFSIQLIDLSATEQILNLNLGGVIRSIPLDQAHRVKSGGRYFFQLPSASLLTASLGAFNLLKDTADVITPNSQELDTLTGSTAYTLMATTGVPGFYGTYVFVSSGSTVTYSLMRYDDSSSIAQFGSGLAVKITVRQLTSPYTQLTLTPTDGSKKIVISFYTTGVVEYYPTGTGTPISTSFPTSSPTLPYTYTVLFSSDILIIGNQYNRILLVKRMPGVFDGLTDANLKIKLSGNSPSTGTAIDYLAVFNHWE